MNSCRVSISHHRSRRELYSHNYWLICIHHENAPEHLILLQLGDQSCIYNVLCHWNSFFTVQVYSSTFATATMIFEYKCNWEAIDSLELDGSVAIIVSFAISDVTTEH